ncbi:uncharacterized protein LOC124690655 [Lolium rigidum]|uniref:uncharacterized protein LOC124690655 n=1 Tax=Lolium rigidum TaxID=89674 RepID=UPI001F5E065A|nr:uncharacterized protein LOC124690655 [Lolium rigidum]
MGNACPNPHDKKNQRGGGVVRPTAGGGRLQLELQRSARAALLIAAGVGYPRRRRFGFSSCSTRAYGLRSSLAIGGTTTSAAGPSPPLPSAAVPARFATNTSPAAPCNQHRPLTPSSSLSVSGELRIPPSSARIKPCIHPSLHQLLCVLRRQEQRGLLAFNSGDDGAQVGSGRKHTEILMVWHARKVNNKFVIAWWLWVASVSCSAARSLGTTLGPFMAVEHACGLRFKQQRWM